MSSAIATACAEIFYAATPAERRATAANIRRILGDGADARAVRRLTRRVYHQYAACFVDFLASPGYTSLADARFSYHDEQKAHFDRALAAGRGVLLVSAHLGNWELGASLFTLIGYPVTVVTAEEEAPEVNRFIARLRRGNRAEVIALGRHRLGV